MFYCEECYFTFTKPRVYVERHGLSSPPFEKVFACPKCGGLCIEEKRRML